MPADRGRCPRQVTLSSGAGAEVFHSYWSGCHTLAVNASPAPPDGPLRGYEMRSTQIVSLVPAMPTRTGLSPHQSTVVSW